MSVRAIVSGTLFRAPIEKTSKAGKPYLLATIREGKGDACRWIKAFIFSESACDEIRRLGDGEPIAICGEINVELYDKDGEQRLGWSIVADGVLTARRPPKAEREQNRQAKTNGRDRARASWASPTRASGKGDFDDSIPF